MCETSEFNGKYVARLTFSLTEHKSVDILQDPLATL